MLMSRRPLLRMLALAPFLLLSPGTAIPGGNLLSSVAGTLQNFPGAVHSLVSSVNGALHTFGCAKRKYEQQQMLSLAESSVKQLHEASTTTCPAWSDVQLTDHQLAFSGNLFLSELLHIVDAPLKHLDPAVVLRVPAGWQPFLRLAARRLDVPLQFAILLAAMGEFGNRYLVFSHVVRMALLALEDARSPDPWTRDHDDRENQMRDLHARASESAETLMQHEAMTDEERERASLSAEDLEAVQQVCVQDLRQCDTDMKALMQAATAPGQRARMVWVVGERVVASLLGTLRAFLFIVSFSDVLLKLAPHLAEQQTANQQGEIRRLGENGKVEGDLKRSSILRQQVGRTIMGAEWSRGFVWLVVLFTCIFL